MARDQYRITFYPSATVRLDPLEFAWLLSKHNLEVVAYSDNAWPMLFVRAYYPHNVSGFMRDVNRVDGPLIFDHVEVVVDGSYVDFEAYEEESG